MTTNTPDTPDMPAAPGATGSDHAPYTNNANVKDGDLRILTYVGLFAMSVLLIFGAAVYWSGLLNFPTISGDPAERDYLNDTLAYRERRMAMALVMRTFLTGFSFVVGLALCTMGGLFILRQVTSLTSLSGNMGGAGGGLGAKLLGEGDDSSAKEVAERIKQTQFSFASYSPGVLFMAGGVLIMVVTQILAIPVRAVEIVPQGAAALCADPETGNFETCKSGSQQIDGNLEVAMMPQSDAVETMAVSVAEPLASESQTAFLGADQEGGDLGFVESSAVVEQAPPDVFVELAFMQPAALDQVDLPEGYAITGFRPEEILVEGNGLTFTFYTYELDFAAPDWGIELPEN